MGKNRQVGKYLTPRLGNADFHSVGIEWGNFGEELLIPKNGEKFSKWTQNWDAPRPCLNS